MTDLNFEEMTKQQPNINVGAIGLEKINKKQAADLEKIRKKQRETTENFLRPWENVRWPRFENIIWKEGCISGGENIRTNPKRDTKTGGNISDIIWDGYYSISEMPLFGWHENSEVPYLFDNSLGKFLFCFAKATILFPFYLVYLIIFRFFGMMLKAFGKTFYRAGISVINIFVMIFSLGQKEGLVGLKQYEYKDANNPSVLSQDTSYPNFVNLIGNSLGVIIPFHIFDKNMGRNFGKGEIGVFIIISAIISFILITYTGINIFVISGTFLFFLFKSFLGLKDAVFSKDTQQKK